MHETLKPETSAEVVQEGHLIEVAGQTVRTNQKPRKLKRKLRKRKKK